MTCRTDNDLGAYVLHALEPAEADAVQLHLTGCEACRDEVHRLADTASLLALLTLQDIEQLYDLDQVGSGAAAHTGPRPGRAALAVTAAVLTASASVGVVRAFTGDPKPSNPGVVQVVDPATHVRATVTMTSRSAGTQLRLRLAGAYPSGSCSLVAHSRDGGSDIAATWVADPHGAADVAGATAIRTSRLSELDVVTDTGQLLVRITLPQHRT